MRFDVYNIPKDFLHNAGIFTFLTSKILEIQYLFSNCGNLYYEAYRLLDSLLTFIGLADTIGSDWSIFLV